MGQIVCVRENCEHTMRFHVDDLMSCHVDKKVNDEFLEWFNMENMQK